MRIHEVFFLFLSLYLMSCSSDPKLITIKPLENGLFSMQCDEVSLLIDPKLGARIVSAQINEKEILLQQGSQLLNWGSTFWPSPQIRWNWPPPFAIHFGGYNSEIQGDKLVMISDTDPELGLSVRKEFSFHENGKYLRIMYEMKNEMDSVVHVGPWEITCVPAVGAKVFFKLGPVPENAASTLEFHDRDGIGWFDFDKDKISGNVKLFSNTPQGWLAQINQDRVLFVKTFDVIPASDLPPGQGNVEVYASQQFEYIELENHGKYHRLAPVASLHYEVKWYISILPDHVPADQMSKALINHVQSVIN
jgi:hypothetical protein